MTTQCTVCLGELGECEQCGETTCVHACETSQQNVCGVCKGTEARHVREADESEVAA